MDKGNVEQNEILFSHEKRKSCTYMQNLKQNNNKTSDLQKQRLEKSLPGLEDGRNRYKLSAIRLIRSESLK